MKHFFATVHKPLSNHYSRLYTRSLLLPFHIFLDISNSVCRPLASTTRHALFMSVQQPRIFICFASFLDGPYLTNSNSLMRRDMSTLGNNDNSSGTGTTVITRFECGLACCPRFAGACAYVSSWEREARRMTQDGKRIGNVRAARPVNVKRRACVRETTAEATPKLNEWSEKL